MRRVVCLWEKKTSQQPFRQLARKILCKCHWIKLFLIWNPSLDFPPTLGHPSLSVQTLGDTNKISPKEKSNDSTWQGCQNLVLRSTNIHQTLLIFSNLSFTYQAITEKTESKPMGAQGMNEWEKMIEMDLTSCKRSSIKSTVQCTPDFWINLFSFEWYRLLFYGNGS
jgi:hypothetical protein